MATKVIGVAIAGAAGALSRWGVVTLVARWMPATVGAFPIGTLAVNVLGSLLFGLLIGIAGGFESVPRIVVDIALIGFLGAFTTFSTFSFDTLELLRTERYGAALLYVGVSVTAGILAALLGIWLAARIAGVPNGPVGS